MHVKHETVPTNGIKLHVATAGPSDGPLIILLHGFPEFWYGWRNQIEVLAARGYRVWAPDQRGYNTSDKPEGLRAYHFDTLATDIFGLIDAAGVTRAHIVGHDWGGMVAWWMAMMDPDQINRLVCMNIPHPVVMQKTLLTSFKQLRRSWYALWFLLPWIPERMFARNNWQWGLDLLKSWGPRTFNDEDLEHYRVAWSQPRAMTCMINYYRAAVLYRPAPLTARVRVPTLLIWGARDGALGKEMAEPSVAFCDDGRVTFLQNATHWVHHDEPDRVNELLIDFLA